jgi:hypothetical protein
LFTRFTPRPASAQAVFILHVTISLSAPCACASHGLPGFNQDQGSAFSRPYHKDNNGLVVSQRERTTIQLAQSERANMNRFTSLCGAALLAAAAWTPLSCHAVDVLNEDFDDVSSLPGWTRYNASTAPGTTWFQGNAGIFSAHAGAANSYAAANFLGAQGGAGMVDNWLITPTLALSGVTSLSFWANRDGAAGFSDQIEVRFGAGSTGTGLPVFDLLLGTIGGDNFQAKWQQWSGTLNFDGNGRFALRYLGEAQTLNYVGIDSMRVITAVPEPSTYLMLLAGLAAVGASARRMRKQAST